MSTQTLERRRRRAAARWAALTAGSRPVVYIGMGSCGLAAGAGEVLAAVRGHLEERGIDAEIVPVGCIGPCYLEPLLDVQLPGRPRLSYSNMTGELAVKTLDALLAGELPRRHLVGRLDPADGAGNPAAGNGDGTRRPCRRRWPRRSCRRRRRPERRRPCRRAPILRPRDAQGPGAHRVAQLRRHRPRPARPLPRPRRLPGLRELPRTARRDVLETVKASGLRGRGGAGFPTGMKWLVCRETGSGPRNLICNADEGDPGAFMNRSLIEGDPHAVLEGMLIAAYAIGATQGYVYCAPSTRSPSAACAPPLPRRASSACSATDILGSDFSFDVTLKEGAGAFVCGEETALIASIEGRRGMPRTRPPFPAVSGLWGQPTIINNVETLATLPADRRPRRRVVCGPRHREPRRAPRPSPWSARSAHGGLVEVPLGTTLRTVIYEIGGGLHRTEFKAVQTRRAVGRLPARGVPRHSDRLREPGGGRIDHGLGRADRPRPTTPASSTSARYFLQLHAEESRAASACPAAWAPGTWSPSSTPSVPGRGELADLDRLERLARVIKAAPCAASGRPRPTRCCRRSSTFATSSSSTSSTSAAGRSSAATSSSTASCPASCTGCQRCVAVCPTGAITGPRAEPHNLDPEKCIKCRSCYEVCRFDAIAGDAIVIESRGQRAA